MAPWFRIFAFVFLLIFFMVPSMQSVKLMLVDNGPFSSSDILLLAISALIWAWILNGVASYLEMKDRRNNGKNSS